MSGKKKRRIRAHYSACKKARAMIFTRTAFAARYPGSISVERFVEDPSGKSGILKPRADGPTEGPLYICGPGSPVPAMVSRAVECKSRGTRVRSPVLGVDPALAQQCPPDGGRRLLATTREKGAA